MGSAAAPAGPDARALARAIGNRAFARLTTARQTLQRVGGWSGATTAANQGETVPSGYRRIPVQGLTPVAKALVLIGPKLDPSQPVDVLVHLHGQNQGYKDDSPRDLDPDKDRFESQLAAAGRPQLVAVLPQGSSDMADYGEFSRLDPRAFATAALAKVAALDTAAGTPGGLGQAPTVGSVMLSGHSGGGFAIKAILDKPALANDLSGVIWFDAVQALSGSGDKRASTGQREAAEKLISTRVKAELDAAGAAPTKASLATGFWFRLYYDAGGLYGGAAGEVDTFLKGLFGEAGRVPAGQAALAARIALLDPDARTALRARYQVLPVPRTGNVAAAAAAGMGTTGHENIIGSGALQNALTAIPGARVVLARSEDVAARLIDTAAARGRSGTAPEDGKSLLTRDDIRTTLQARATNATVLRDFNSHCQLIQSVAEGPSRDARYDAEAGLLVNELETEFIHDPTKSAVDLLPPDRAAHYRGITWGVNDYPGNGGAEGGEAAAMAHEMTAIRPERRPNVGGSAVITQAELTANLTRLHGHLKPVDGQTGATLFDEAADQFSDMAAIASLDGVTLRILSSWRDPAVAAANAAKSGNPNAVASYSSHSLGLAVDLEMSGGSQHFAEIQTHPMSNVFAMRSSEVHKWMVFRGAWFGWYPYGNEPWHWEYNPAGLRDRYRAGVIPQKPTAQPPPATQAPTPPAAVGVPNS